MKRGAMVLVVALILHCILFVTASIAQITLPRPRDGKLTETTSARRAEARVDLTGKNGTVIQTFNFPDIRLFGTNTPRGPEVTFDIPEEVLAVVDGDLVTVPVIDVRQTTEILQDSGQVADLMIEAVFFDSATGEFILGNIFGALAQTGVADEVLIPDLFADTNGNGMLGDGDMLFSLVDLNVYVNAMPSFSLGDSFSIVNGAVEALPGMMFSTTAFTFDPITGFSGTPFSGVGIADAQHGVSAVPQVGTLTLLAGGLVGLGAVAWRRQHRP